MPPFRDGQKMFAKGPPEASRLEAFSSSRVTLVHTWLMPETRRNHTSAHRLWEKRVLTGAFANSLGALAVTTRRVTAEAGTGVRPRSREVDVAIPQVGTACVPSIGHSGFPAESLRGSHLVWNLTFGK